MLRSDLDLSTLPLDARQGFLASRLDGRTDLESLGSLTGLEPEAVAALLGELVAMGAVEAPEGAQAAAAEPDPGEPDLGEPDLGEPDLGEPDLGEPERGEPDHGEVATHRQCFETRLRHLPVDQRIALARSAQEPELGACCFDPMPQVVAALLENPRLGPLQARLVAAHHRSAAGLEALAGHAGFARDPGVRRALLANPVLPPGLYRRLWAGQRLLTQFQVTTSRDCPEQTRAMARELLRACFLQRTGEERVELILTTEGRCLAALAGLTIDGRTTALLCQRTYASTLLIQNLARWAAAPPQLIAHLRRQELVRRNPTLRQMLERHPNAG